jgi:hypothetical protein
VVLLPAKQRYFINDEIPNGELSGFFVNTPQA